MPQSHFADQANRLIQNKKITLNIVQQQTNTKPHKAMAPTINNIQQQQNRDIRTDSSYCPHLLFHFKCKFDIFRYLSLMDTYICT